MELGDFPYIRTQIEQAYNDMRNGASGTHILFHKECKVIKGEILSGGVNATCECCGKKVGFVSWEEAIGIATMGEKLICFDCDEVNANQIPEALYPAISEMIAVKEVPEAKELVITTDTFMGKVSWAVLLV